MTAPLSRRSFLAATGVAGLAAVAPYAAGRSAAGTRPRPVASRRAQPNDRIGLALIGCGKRMFEILVPLMDHPDLWVAGVCDVDTTRREEARRRVDAHNAAANPLADVIPCLSVVDYDELLSNDRIDAVVICTPDHWHANQVIDAAKAGKDIYCEKPLTQCLHECKAMIEAVRKHGRVFQTGSQQRTEYDHRFVRACELVRAGRLGRVMSVHVGVGDPPRACDLGEEAMEPGLDWHRWLGPAPQRPYHSALSPRGMHGHYPEWRHFKEFCGGYLADMGAHHFDIAQWGLGLDASGPVRVEPGDVANADGSPALRGATLVTGDGIRIVHGGPSGTTFIGTDGVIAVDRGRLHSVPGNILDAELSEQQRLPRKQSHIQDWVDCMRSRERCICDVEIGARSAALCHLLNLAYEHRRPLEWNPIAWEFPGDAEANGWRERARRTGFELPAW